MFTFIRFYWQLTITVSVKINLAIFITCKKLNSQREVVLPLIANKSFPQDVLHVDGHVKQTSYFIDLTTSPGQAITNNYYYFHIISFVEAYSANFKLPPSLPIIFTIISISVTIMRPF